MSCCSLSRSRFPPVSLLLSSHLKFLPFVEWRSHSRWMSRSTQFYFLSLLHLWSRTHWTSAALLPLLSSISLIHLINLASILNERTCTLQYCRARRSGLPPSCETQAGVNQEEIATCSSPLHTALPNSITLRWRPQEWSGLFGSPSKSSGIRICRLPLRWDCSAFHQAQFSWKNARTVRCECLLHNRTGYSGDRSQTLQESWS